METYVSITQLAPKTVTRPRGEEAYQKLREHLLSEIVEVDLSSAKLLSFSFLDGLILQLVENNQLEMITFVAPDPELQRKLAQVAGVRSVKIFFREKKGEPRRIVQPRATVKIELESRP
jgi:hypothetical protein